MLKRFIKDERGNVMLMMAGFFVPLVAIMGVAVDTAELYRARTTYQNAVDAAALSAAKVMAKQGGSPSAETNAQQAAERVFNANIRNLPSSEANVELDFGNGNCAVDGVKATASLRHRMFFDPIHKVFSGAGDANHANMNVESHVTCGNDTVEIALVLDNSGSMQWSGKLNTLRTASRNLVNTLHDSMQGSLRPDPIKFAVVPFSGMVNVGANNRNASWMDRTGRSPIHHEMIDWSVDPGNVKVGDRWRNASGD